MSDISLCKDKITVKDGKILIAYLDYLVAPGNTVEIVNIFVKPQYRRMKYGTQMIRYLQKAFEEHTIFLFTEASNTIAHAFYDKLGFSNSYLLPDFYQDQSAYIFYKKD